MTRLLAATTVLALVSGPILAAPAIAQNEALEETPGDPSPATEGRVIGEDEPVALQIDEEGALDILINGYSDAHPLVGVTVTKSGAPVGAITHIHYDEDTDSIDAAVVEIAPPSASAQGRKVEVAAEHLGLDSDTVAQPPLELTLSREALEALPSFEVTWALRYPDTAFPFRNGTEEAEEPQGAR